MVIRFGSLPRLALALAGALVLASGPSQAQQPASASDDPYFRVTQEIWSFIREKCRLPQGGAYQIAILGVPPDDMRFTADQKDFLAQKINSAASFLLRNEPTAKAVISVREVAEMIAIMGAGQSRAQVDELIKKAENYNVGIQVRGGRVSQRGFRIALTALGRNGIDCSEQTSAVDLPPDAFPENIVGADELLSRAAQHVLERSRGKREQVISLRSRMIDGKPAPDIWNESLARSFNRGVPLARNRLPVRSLETNELRAEPVTDAPKPDNWRTEIVLDRSGRTGTRVEVEVRAPEGAGQESTAYDGLVDPDALPPLPVQAAPAPPPLQPPPPVQPPPPAAQPAPQPAAPPPAQVAQKPAPQPAPKPVPVATPPKPPQPLPLSQTAQRFRVTLSAADRRQEFAFSTPQSLVIEIDLLEVSGAEPPAIGLIDARGRLHAPANPPGRARPHLKRWRLPAGEYTLWLEHKGQLATDLVLRTRAAFDSLVPEPLGQLVRIAGDWVVGVREQASGEKVCYAFTAALDTQPSNWRLLSPFLLFQITPESDAVQHRFDAADEWSDARKVVAEVLRANRWERLPMRPDEGVLRVLEPCRGQPGNCLAESALYGMTNGQRLSLSGVTRSGAQGIVNYSLKGYQAAMFSMASLCGRRDFADRLVVLN